MSDGIEVSPILKDVLSQIVLKKSEEEWGQFIELEGIESVENEGLYYRVGFSVKVAGLFTLTPKLRIRKSAIESIMRTYKPNRLAQSPNQTTHNGLRLESKNPPIIIRVRK